MKNNTLTDHTLIIYELEKSIEFYNWGFILSYLPEGSFLVGGYIRDIILGRIPSKIDIDIDIDIVVPSNAIEVGKKISEKFRGKLIVLDEKREVVRIIFNNISIDIANQLSKTIEGDLKRRDFSINSIAFLLDKKLLFDPLNGIKDIEISLIRTYSETNLIEDPLRILRCFRFVSELQFNIESKLTTLIKKYKGSICLVANERINYEIQRIITGVNAIQSITFIKKFEIFGIQEIYEDTSFLDLNKINYEHLNQRERKQFLPLFFLSQILDKVSLERLKFSKAEILKINLLRKWNITLKNRTISQLNEAERFQLHKELEDILPSFIFYLPQNLHSSWIMRWRDKEDKLFHPSNLINGDVIKKHLSIKDGPTLGQLLYYLSLELAYKRLNNFDEAIYKAKQWIEQNAPKCD